MNSKHFTDALLPGTKLLWFEILQVLGKGGFGITYLGRDTNQDKLVAIKEYLPTAFASRTESREVRPNSSNDAKTFEWGLERFLKEAQILARFKHAAIVRVISFFRDSNTAYMVMDYVEGEGLDAILKKRKTLPEAELKVILPPLLEGLEELHNSHFIHRDLKPPNILIRKDGSPIILDFGSARQSVAGQGDEMTSLLSLGYSPFEQYDSSGERQGAWSDIYAMSGVLYRCISGKKPPDAAMRIAARLRNDTDPMLPAVVMGKGRYSEKFLAAIDHALMVLETERPQTIDAWRMEILELKERPAPQKRESVMVKSLSSQSGSQVKKRKKSSWRSFISSVSEFGREVEDGETTIASRQGSISLPNRGDNGKTAAQPAGSVVKPLPRPEIPPSRPVPTPLPSAKVVPVKQTLEGSQKPATHWVDPNTKMAFIWVPAGKFLMGSQEKEPGRDGDEGPVHEVELAGFWLGKYPVTWAVWRQVMGNYPQGLYDPSKANHPVERVGWEDVRKFLMRLSNMGEDSQRFRLPTEAEWEYAARAGTQGLFFFKGGGRELPNHAWFKSNSEKRTHPVGEKKPNSWGFHDLLGNVWEWVEDWYSLDFYKNSPTKNPSRTGGVGKNRSVRGGSWASPPRECRVANRQPVSPKMRNSMVGFRVVRMDK
ncbi:MAG: SUMF1/EgtB/PvdO family nonheme iron enzyme [Magnetococcales bacterium]|nr:SUMF1/EgtB/PvdO family nonheme iron enzyme [Magnetococcales bacterium]